MPFCGYVTRVDLVEHKTTQVVFDELFLYQVAGPNSVLPFHAYNPDLARLVNPATDHIFYAGPGSAMILREKDKTSQTYRIVAPLHRVWLAAMGREKTMSLCIGSLLESTRRAPSSTPLRPLSPMGS